jgi:Na+/alanine symporter
MVQSNTVAAATADTSHPAKQGLIQALGVAVDTLVVCSATAFIVLVSDKDVYDPANPGKYTGASLTQAAVTDALADVAMGVMALVNLVAIVLLGQWAFGALEDYKGATARGEDPAFVARANRDLPGDLVTDVW